MSATFNWFPGHMNKTLKEIEERIPIVDLVIEVIDARAPFSSQNQTFKKVLKNKPILSVLSKTDVADPQVTKKWIQYFKRQERLLMIYDEHDKNLVKDLIGYVNEATKTKQTRDREKGLAVSLVNALVIGIPNVGKSTLINRLIKDKSVKVGNRPGVTRGIQLLHLNETISLMDTPGVLPSKIGNERMAANLCGINSIKENVFPRERVAGILMKYIFNNYPGLIENHYRLEDLRLKRPVTEADTYKIFEAMAQSSKVHLRSDVLMVERTMEHFMHELADGKFRVSLETPAEIKEDEAQRKKDE